MSLDVVAGAVFILGVVLVGAWLRDRPRSRLGSGRAGSPRLNPDALEGADAPPPGERYPVRGTGVRVLADDGSSQLPVVAHHTGRSELASTLHRHVSVLAAAPRNRNADTGHLTAARRYAIEQLRAAVWTVTPVDFTTPRGLGVSDAGYPTANLWPLRLRGPVPGVNVIATRGRPITADTLLVLAHLDSVRNSPGADDNATGAAVVLAAAAGIPPPSGARDVALALVDLEEITMGGSVHLARTVTPGAVLNLESVGYYQTSPGSQRMPAGLGKVAPVLAAQVKARQSAGDFALVVHRPDSTAVASAWADAATQAGLPTIMHRDNRYTGPGFRLERLVNLVGANLDRSDHAPFWNAGVPSVVVSDTAPLRNPNYHRPSDTADTLDYDSLAAVTAAVTATATQWQSGAIPDPAATFAGSP